MNSKTVLSVKPKLLRFCSVWYTRWLASLQVMKGWNSKWKLRSCSIASLFVVLCLKSCSAFSARVRDHILTQPIILPAWGGSKFLSRINKRTQHFGEISSRKDINRLRNSDYIHVKVTSNFRSAESLIPFDFTGGKNVVKSAQKDQLALLWSQ